MGKSLKKHPSGTFVVYNHSNKKDKRLANRKLRRVNKVILKTNRGCFKKMREVSNVWNFNSDGLPGTFSDQNPIYDWHRHCYTTIAEARREKNYPILRAYLMK